MKTPAHMHRRYENILMDSARWASFTPRPGDIIISTPYKAGTTWTQRICSLLIYKQHGLDAQINTLSPWLDAKFEAIESVIATYDAQTARRFIKTHTPLDGLPYFPQASYLVCGRDPRDIFMSVQNHYANMDPSRMAELLGLTQQQLRERPVLPDDINERFELWLTKASFPWEQDGFPLWSVFHHLQSFWDIRKHGNVYFLHYQNLLDDLPGEMMRLAEFLRINIEPSLWPALIEAAGFEAMRRDARHTAPNAHKGLWLDSQGFFHRGSSGQWRGVLTAENLQLYERVKNERVDAALAQWLEKGRT